VLFRSPVALFMVLFVIFYYAVEQKKWKTKGVYVLVLFVLSLTCLKLYSTKEGSYEGNFFNELMSHDLHFSNILNFYSLHFFLIRLKDLYFWIALLLIAQVIIFIIKKQHLKTAYILVATFGFLIITLITYNKGDADVMMERSFMPLTVFILLPFFSSIQKIEKLLNKILILILIIVVCIASMARITLEGNRFSSRLAYVNELIEQTKEMNVKKLLLPETKEYVNQIMTRWSFPFTTIIISSFDGPENTCTILFYKNLEEYKQSSLEKTNIFLGANFWLEWPIDNLNKKYFRLPDKPYTVLK
jgi:hypothetical protein